MKSTFSQLTQSIPVNFFARILIASSLIVILNNKVISQTGCETCTGNLIENPSFEIGTTNWSVSPAGEFFTGPGYAQCGTSNYAYLDATYATPGSPYWFWQQESNVTPGNVYRLTIFGGTFENSYDHQFRLAFYTSGGSLIGTPANAQIDYVVNGNGTLQLYTILATAPSNTSYLRVEGRATGNSIKVDHVCLTLSCDNITSGGTIGSDQSSCGTSYDPAPFTNIAFPTGGSGPIEYSWLQSTTTCVPGAPGWSTIPGANASTYDSPSITQNTCFVRLSRRQGCPQWDGVSNVINVSLSGILPSVAITGNLSICSGNSTTLNVSSSGGTAPYSYIWNKTTYSQTVQAENGTVSGGATIESTQSNFNGSGYIEFYTTNGEAVNIPVTVPSAGTYHIVIRHAFESPSVLPLGVRINNIAQPNVNIAGSGSGNTWRYVDIGSYSLAGGVNQIKFSNVNNNAVDIDEIIVTQIQQIGTGNNITVSPTVTTSYLVSSTDANGCGYNDFATVNVSQCSDFNCPGNLVQNPSFENGTSNWASSGGNFSVGTYAAVFGANAGHFQITNGANNSNYQTVASGSISPGSSLTLNVYAGKIGRAHV